MLMPALNMRNCLELVLYIVFIPNARCAVPTVAESRTRGERSKGSVMAKAARSWKYFVKPATKIDQPPRLKPIYMKWRR